MTRKEAQKLEQPSISRGRVSQDHLRDQSREVCKGKQTPEEYSHLAVKSHQVVTRSHLDT